MTTSVKLRELRARFLQAQDPNNSVNLPDLEALIKQLADEIDLRLLNLNKIMKKERAIIKRTLAEGHRIESAAEPGNVDPFYIVLAALKQHDPNGENRALRNFSAGDGNSIRSLCRAAADLCSRLEGSAEQHEHESVTHRTPDYTRLAQMKMNDPEKYPTMSYHEVMAALQLRKSAVYEHPYLELASTGTRKRLFLTESVIAVRRSSPQ